MIDRLDDLTLADAHQFSEHIKGWQQSIEQLTGKLPNYSLEMQYIAILKPSYLHAVAARIAELNQDDDPEIPF
jgi:hypothetical protein